MCLSAACLLAVSLLTACSDDSTTDVNERHHVTFEAQYSAPTFVEESKDDLSRFGSPFTRAWTPTSPYVTYGDIYDTNGMFANQKNLVNKSINAFFTKDGAEAEEGTFFFRNTDNTWQLSMEIGSNATYYLYGYIPKEDADGANISPNGSYSEGAVLTINGLNAVTPSDVCVIVGAKNGPNANEDGGLTLGQFAVDVKATSPSQATGNYIYLLFDHLYSALRFNFTVDADYAALRTIKLRKLELIAYSNDSGGGLRSKYNATITLKATANGTTPIVGNVTFEADESKDFVAPTALYEWNETDPEVVLDPVTPTSFMGCFVPYDPVYFKLRSTYDVYENVNNTRVRQNCQAENTIDLRDLFGADVYTRRGHSFDCTIKVQPTYLYVLSEPDLDNPTATLE